MDSVFPRASLRGPARLPKMPIAVLLLFIAIDFTITLCLYYCIPHLDEYFEAANLTQMLQIGIKYHLLPYRDIAWCYGPALFYIPEAFMRGSLLLGAPAQVGYLLSLLCLGTRILDVVLGRGQFSHQSCASHPDIQRRCDLFQELSLGVNGVLLRFAAPYGAILLLHRWSSRIVAVRQPAADVQTICGRPLMCLGRAVPIGGTRNCLPGSPIGLLRASCGLCWKIMAVRTAGNRGVVPLWWLAFPESLEMVLGVTKGGCNFPVFPCVFMFMFFLSLFWLLPKLFRVCALCRPGEEVSLVLAWAMLLVCTLPAALGRCEFGHVAHYEIAVFLTTMIVAAKWCRGSFRSIRSFLSWCTGS